MEICFFSAYDLEQKPEQDYFLKLFPSVLRGKSDLWCVSEKAQSTIYLLSLFNGLYKDSSY